MVRDFSGVYADGDTSDSVTVADSGV